MQGVRKMDNNSSWEGRPPPGPHTGVLEMVGQTAGELAGDSVPRNANTF